MGGVALQGGDRIDGELLSLLAEHAAAGRPCVLATVVRTEAPTSAHPGDAAVITADGRLAGWVGGSCAEPLVRREALRAIADGLPRLVRIAPGDEAAAQVADGELTVATTCPSGGALEIFIDPQLPAPLLIAVGASPAARTLVQLAALTGFRTCAVHPGAREEDHPGADAILPLLERIAELAEVTDSWAVVATMGHYDEDALAAVLGLPHAEIALVASSRRARAVLENLRRRGLPETQLARVRTPAGERRAGTQHEIALVALAEIVSRRRERLRSAQPSLAGPPGFAVDPVCGMTVDAAGTVHRVTHMGETHLFCSAGCAERFATEPDRYPRPLLS